MTEHILFGSKRIDFQLEYSNRKSLGITVTPDLFVFVKAPVNASIEKVQEKVKKRVQWILRQQNFFLGFYPKTPVRKYVSGETYLYLGRQYRLKVEIRKEELVKLKGKFIIVKASDKSRVKLILNEWYRKTGKLKIQEIAKPLIEKFKKHKVEPTAIIFRDMPTRWGSCTQKGKIILNPELIKAPKRCIEYVVIHELCHLIYYDHTQKFIDLQSKEMPDWEKWKMKLEKAMV